MPDLAFILESLGVLFSLGALALKVRKMLAPAIVPQRRRLPPRRDD